MRDNKASLRDLRSRLVDEWASAKGRDRIKILVRIMDIEEEIKLYEDRNNSGSKIF